MQIEFRKNAFIDSFFPLLRDQSRYLILRGGRGGGKSKFAVQKFAYRMLTEQNNRFVFARAVKDTIRQSMYQQFKMFIYGQGLQDAFDFRDTDMIIKCPSTNSEIVHVGLNEVERVKSIAEATSAWIEEATELDEVDFRTFNLGIRSQSGGYIQTVLTFNPIDENHWLRKEFYPPEVDELINQKYDKRIKRKKRANYDWIDYDLEDVVVTMSKNITVGNETATITTSHHLSTYEDNPFVDIIYKAGLEDIKEKDYGYWLVAAKGQWGTVGDLVFSPMWKFAEFPQSCDEVFYGMDFGYVHPSTLVMVGIKDDVYYVKELTYVKGLTNAQFIEHIKEEKFIETDGLIYADSAEPARIDEFDEAGFNIVPAVKGQNSIADGVDFLKSIDIRTHKDNVNLNRELKTYKRKIGSDGKPIENEYVKLNDDCLAATRYAVWSHAQHNDVKIGFVTRAI